MAKTNNDGYTSSITASMRELSGKEKVRFKDLTASTKLDEVVTPEESLKIELDNYITLSVHNPVSENPDYNVYIVVDKNGNSYYTSSETFNRAVSDVCEAMAGDNSEWGIEVFKRASSNYKGKFFITCTVY